MKTRNSILSVTTEVEVQFYDVDAMRIVWHGNYIKYLERARCELLKSFDYNYLEMEQSGYMWPIVDMRLKYVKPTRFGQTILIEASLVEYESRIKINYKISNKETGEVLTKAYTVQVAVAISDNEMQFESPQVLLDKLADKIN